MSIGENEKKFALHELYLITTAIALNGTSLDEFLNDNSRENLSRRLNSLSEKSYNKLEKTIGQMIIKYRDDFNKFIELSFKFNSEEDGQEFMRNIISIIAVELNDFLIED